MMASNDGSPARSRSSRTRAWVSVLRRHSGPSRRVPWGRNVGERHGAWGERCAQGVNTRAESVNRLRLAYVALRSPLRLHAVRPVGTARRMPMRHRWRWAGRHWRCHGKCSRGGPGGDCASRSSRGGAGAGRGMSTPCCATLFSGECGLHASCRPHGRCGGGPCSTVALGGGDGAVIRASSATAAMAATCAAPMVSGEAPRFCAASCASTAAIVRWMALTRDTPRMRGPRRRRCSRTPLGPAPR
jgi:hypothetical protein